mmetsp:Transcript_88698/g.225823  ORF Transcript_88698/g.225823 Transcript_88698/m.225823 type:complete len:242 (-) Transcript_88698:621-1346(-)
MQHTPGIQSARRSNGPVTAAGILELASYPLRTWLQRRHSGGDLLITRGGATQHPPDRVRERGVVRVEGGLGLRIHPGRQGQEDLTVVAGDHRQVVLAHLGRERICVVGDLVDEVDGVRINFAFRGALQVLDREPPGGDGPGHVRALVALATVAREQDVAGHECEVGVRNRRRRASLRGGEPAFGGLAAGVRLAQETLFGVLLIAINPVRALVDLCARPGANAHVVRVELVRVLAVVLPATG